MVRTQKAQESTPVPFCEADGKRKNIYHTEAEARTAADVAESRTYGAKFTTYRCGGHWHIAHAEREV